MTAVRDTLAQQGAAVELQTAEEVFAISRLLGSSAQLRSAVADPTAEAAAKAALAQRAFGGRIGAPALAIVSSAVTQRWSSSEDLVAGLEEAGVRAAAASAPAGVSITDELFAFGGAVTSDAQLELALRSKLADSAAKAGVVDRLLGTKVSPNTVAIARQLVQDPRGRSIRESLRWASQIVAGQNGAVLATVTSAVPLQAAQLERLRSVLSARYGATLAFNTVIDPALIGGLRVQVGDDVIDSSIATRLSDVRLQLA